MWSLIIPVAIFIILMYIMIFSLAKASKDTPDQELAFAKWQEEMKNKKSNN